jgi:DNA processing protein
VLELIGRPGHHLIDAPRGPTRSRDKLSIRDQQVLDAVPKTRPAAADSIARIAGIKLLDTQAALRRLKEKGLVAHYEEGWMLHESALV